MQQIINFIIRNKSFLLFLLLFSIALIFTIQSHSYHKSKFVNSANFLSGGLYNSINNISQYFDLKEQNRILHNENNVLKSTLFNSNINKDSSYIDSMSFHATYKLTPAVVIKNSYALQNNFLTLNRGKRDSIKQDLGVVSSKGIIGLIDNTSHKYATVLSVLNTKSRISAQLKKTNHFGTLKWNGHSSEFTQLVDIPSKAPIVVGDTIITSGRSAIFPKGILIGVVESFKLDNAKDFYEINVKLFNDMTNIEHVYIIENTDANEIKNLIDIENE